MIEFGREIYANRYVIWSLVVNDLKRRYRNSFLGVAWSFLSPLGLVLVIGFIFSKVLGVKFESFVPFLFSGMMPWIFITQCADMGANCFLSGEGYIKQINIPLIVFPVRVALGAFINLLIALVSFSLILAIIQPGRYGPGTFMTLPGLIIIFFTGVGLSVLSGTINTFIRDFSHIQGIALQALFYATPIIYPVETLGEKYSWIYKYNPIYHIINIIREPLLNNTPASTNSYFWAISFTAGLVVFSILLLRASKRALIFKI